MASMTVILIMVALVVVTALAFDFINGFHDTANAIATVVATRVLPPQAAILMAAGLNFVGALISTEVAATIAGGLVKDGEVTQPVVLAAVLGAIVWQLITWYYGIPSSSSHALIGGLIGGAVLRGGMDAVQWNGVLDKVLLPLVGSPLAGFILGFIIMALITLLFARYHPFTAGRVFGRLQLLTAAGMAFAHGSNDAQKSMGIILLALLTARTAALAMGQDIPQFLLDWHLFPYPTDGASAIPTWVIFSCATAMAVGTSMGGWRIMKTMGHKIIRLEPVHGSAAELAAAATILTASHLGMPVSTTQVISGSIFGVGACKRVNAVRWGVAQNMAVAWILTLPAAALVAVLVYQLLVLVQLA